jgi:hypothetical protein
MVTHKVTNSASDRTQLASIASQAQTVFSASTYSKFGYFSGEQILKCHNATTLARNCQRERRLTMLAHPQSPSSFSVRSMNQRHATITMPKVKYMRTSITTATLRPVVMFPHAS